jgi:hypothetical protein
MKQIYRWMNYKFVDLLFRAKNREGVIRFYEMRGQPIYAIPSYFDAC